MRVLSKPAVFEWDKGNTDKNLVKHSIARGEIEQAFVNDPKILFKDQKHSSLEERQGIFGRTNKGILLTIIFTIRGEKIRIISARNASKKERRSYEQKVKANPKI